jgi:hypothetical protein
VGSLGAGAGGGGAAGLPGLWKRHMALKRVTLLSPPRWAGALWVQGLVCPIGSWSLHVIGGVLGGNESK